MTFAVRGASNSFCGSIAGQIWGRFPAYRAALEAIRPFAEVFPMKSDAALPSPVAQSAIVTWLSVHSG
ncbi:hypothetical protein ASD85_12575 [Rhizobium sp. Root651]|nr:hypothetical protein ASD85_12575 [Rhizobium sp. Root651]